MIMSVFIFAFVFILLVVAAMAIGVIIANKPIKGSCGGLSALGMKEQCLICGVKPEDLQQQKPEPQLFYDASQSQY